MIYAIGVESKRHAIYTKGAPLGDEDFRLVEADAAGWVPWSGGECPLPDGALHETKSARGDVERLDNPEKDHWDMRHGSARIIAYRPILDAKPEAPMPEQGTDATTPRRPFLDSGRLRERFGPFDVSPPAWNGEGLPPVGVECEAYVVNRGAWAKVKIRAHDGDVAIFKNGTGHLYAGGTADSFRPIRSAEERAVEEMSRIIADGHDVYIGAHEAAQRLYRAGYRKTGDE